MNGYKGREKFIEKLNKLVDDNHHYLYLIDGVFDGVKSIEKSIYDYERREPTKDIPGFEGTLEALNELTIIK
jgi:uncharacterized protein YoxC|tara:strand:- start:17 stop:232 length:216 start_codon:yes stop_codon:yes gene_type:complete